MKMLYRLSLLALPLGPKRAKLSPAATSSSFRLHLVAHGVTGFVRHRATFSPYAATLSMTKRS